MKKKSLFISIIMLVILSGCSSKEVISKTNEGLPQLLEEQYELGYNKAIKDTKATFIKVGFDKAMKILESIIDENKALMAGKYAIKEAFITNPKFYSTENADGSLTFKTVGCQIDKRISSKEMLQFHAKYSNLIPVKNKTNIDNKDEDFTFASFSNSNATQNKTKNPNVGTYEKKDLNKVQKVRELNGTKEVILLNTAENRLILDSFPYEKIIENNNIIMTFPNEKNAEDFCENFKDKCI